MHDASNGGIQVTGALQVGAMEDVFGKPCLGVSNSYLGEVASWSDGNQENDAGMGP